MRLRRLVGLDIGVLGDALAAAYDVNVAVASGGADLTESQAVAWVGQFVGFGAPADGLPAPGETIANLTALKAAREHALPDAGWHLRDTPHQQEARPVTETI